MTPRILLIDDDSRLASMVAEYLGHSGFEVETAGSLAAGRSKLAGGSYDALVLDLMLPDGDGLDLCRELRGESRTRHLPLLMLTARGEQMDRILGLELGADDYLPKPFEPRELVARLQAVLRRAEGTAPAEVLRAGPIEVHVASRRATLDGRELSLTTAEFALLALLLRQRGRVLSRERILDETRGVDWDAYDRSVDVLVSRLRQKLGDDSRRQHFIRTVRGAGYCFGGSDE